MLSLGKIDHIHVKVSDIPKAIAWYERVLGMLPDSRYHHMDGDPHGVTMLANQSGSVRIALSETSVPNDDSGSIAFVVSGQDFLEWIDQLAGERVANRDGLTIARDSVTDHGFFCTIAFVDPHGNPFEIISYDHTWLAGKLKFKARV